MRNFPVSGIVPDQLDVLLTGCGEGSFIGPCAWDYNLQASQCFNIRWAAPSRSLEAANWYLWNAGLKPQNVSTDFEMLVRKAVAEAGSPIVAIATPTPAHVGQISAALAAGVADIICDKPLVTSFAEWLKLKAALDASGAGGRIYVTFNHRYSAAVFQLRKLVEQLGSDVVSLEAWFEQDWLMTDPGIRQSDWRLGHPWCGPLDIWTHVADLIAFVAGALITEVSKSTLGTAGKHGRQIFDNGSCNLLFGNGLVGAGRFHQALEGHADDIGIVVRCRSGEDYMWRMAFGADSLLVGPHGANPDNPGEWKAQFPGHGKIFSPEIVAALTKNPPGHIHGWDFMWHNLFSAIYGDMLRERKHPIGENMPPVMKLPVPTFETAAKETILFVEAAVRSHEQNGESVSLEEVQNAIAAA